MRRILIVAAAGVSFLSVPPLRAQASAPSDAEVEEIIVTARRTGIPVWRVSGPTTTLVLIGSINGVDKSTKWDPGALTETLVKADRIMFPSKLGLTGSPFSLVGAYLRFRKQATLPKGQTLANHMPAEQFGRLLALKQRGMLKDGFERRHPLHLALELRNLAQGKSGRGLDASTYVSQAVKKYKLKTVPIATLKAKPVLNDLLTASPRTFVPCLLDTVAVLEAGPGTMKARSDAWADRRVPDAIASPADKMFASCAPDQLGMVEQTPMGAQMRKLMQEPQLTVAVVNLRTLARPNGVLDSLAASGFHVQGPRWKR